MLRIVVLAGLVLATFNPADARGFHFSGRGFARAARTVETPRTRLGIIVPVPRRADDPAQANAVAPTMAVVPPAIAASAVPQPADVPKRPKQTAEAAAHWCDNGAIVGSGTGFCVLKTRADDPS